MDSAMQLGKVYTEILSAPDYIWEGLSEMLGALAASVIITVFTTYVLNRKQEVNKVKGRVLHLRLEMYQAILKLLQEHVKILSYAGERQGIESTLSSHRINIVENEMLLPQRSWSIIRKFKVT